MSDEKNAASTCRWITTEAAALALGVSVKTVQRRARAGTINARKVAGDSGGFVWEIKADATGQPMAQSDGPSDRPDTQATAQAVGQAVGQNSDLSTKPMAQADKATAQPIAQVDNRWDKMATDSPTDRTNDSDGSGRVIEILERENAFLKSQIEAQRLQIEAANRSNAEISAALREALKMSHRALTTGTAKPVEIDGKSSPQILAEAAQNTPNEREQMGTGNVNGQSERTAENVARDGRGFRGWLLKMLRG